MSDLVDLARRYVALSDELEEVRDQIKRVVLNGSGDAARPPQPPVRRAPGGQASHPNTVKAAEVENGIVALLKDQPGLTTARIAAAMNAPTTTTVARLNRLKERGEIAGGGAGGYRVAGAAV